MSVLTERLLFEGEQIRTDVLRTAPRYYLGVDLGQAQDHTALAVIERAELTEREPDRRDWSYRTETRFYLRFVERIGLGAPYPEIVEYVKEMAGRAPLAGALQVIVDATGVGAPVVDLLKRGGLRCPVIPVTITPGDLESSDGVRYRVPKRDLMAGLQVAFQKRRLSIAADLPGLDALIGELRGMRVRVTADGEERYSGQKDDLVMALALAWWRASREAGWGC